LPKTLAQMKRRLEDAMTEASAAEEIIPLIKQAIARFGLEPEDLFDGDNTETTTALYRDANGNTWGGRGRRPTWLSEALALGKTLEDFQVGAALGKTSK
jgi:DNA-binding protein H-NS